MRSWRTGQGGRVVSLHLPSLLNTTYAYTYILVIANKARLETWLGF